MAGTWAILDMPGASHTAAYGSNGNNVVGWYNDYSGNTHGFRYDGTSWSSLNRPGDTGTYAYNISTNNSIVGGFTDASYNPHGFLYDGTAWTTLDAPGGAKGTWANGISGSKIVGQYGDSSNISHGFIYEIPEPATLILFGLGALIIRKHKA